RAAVIASADGLQLRASWHHRHFQMIARPAEVPSRSTHLLTVNEIRHDTAPAGGAASSRGGGLKRVCASFDAPTARLRASFDAPTARLRASCDAQWAAVSKPHPEEAAKPLSRRMERRRCGQMESCSRGE